MHHDALYTRDVSIVKLCSIISIKTFLPEGLFIDIIFKSPHKYVPNITNANKMVGFNMTIAFFKYDIEATLEFSFLYINARFFLLYFVLYLFK